MNFLAEIQALLPSPYSIEQNAVLSQLIGAFALEMEALQEDIDRMRQTHWVNFAYKVTDLEKIGALVGVARLPWEALPEYRIRLLTIVIARLNGAIGPDEIKQFVADFLKRSQISIAAVFVPGLDAVSGLQAFQPRTDQPRYRPLGFVENPPKLRRSNTLLAKGGRVSYLDRWEEINKGMGETVPSLFITGYSDRRTSTPILVNLTTGELIGYKGNVPLGRTLAITPAPADGDPQRATASMNGRDVTGNLFSVSAFTPGVPFEPADFDPSLRLPRMRRGSNQWVYLSAGLYDVRGLDRFFFAIADDQLREGVFNQTFFDESVFPSGPVAGLAMEWTELEPASFEVHVPRYLVIEPEIVEEDQRRPHEHVAEALQSSIAQLHAASVRAQLVFDPFLETQDQAVRVNLPWLSLDPQSGSAGERDVLSLGGRFSESGLGDARFE
jgi:hypothetical protein